MCPDVCVYKAGWSLDPDVLNIKLHHVAGSDLSRVTL